MTYEYSFSAKGKSFFEASTAERARVHLSGLGCSHINITASNYLNVVALGYVADGESITVHKVIVTAGETYQCNSSTASKLPKAAKVI